MNPEEIINKEEQFLQTVKEIHPKLADKVTSDHTFALTLIENRKFIEELWYINAVITLAKPLTKEKLSDAPLTKLNVDIILHICNFLQPKEAQAVEAQYMGKRLWNRFNPGFFAEQRPASLQAYQATLTCYPPPPKPVRDYNGLHRELYAEITTSTKPDLELVPAHRSSCNIL